MIEIFDSFCWTKENKTITQSTHHINGLGNFTYKNYNTPPGPIQMHFHSNIIEVLCIIKGTRSTCIENNGTITNYTYHGNEVFITFPFEIHGNENLPQYPCEYFGFQIKCDNTNEILGLNKEYSQLLLKNILSLKERHLKIGASHLQYIRTAFNFFTDLSGESIHIGVQFLTCFLFSLAFLLPIQEEEHHTVDSRIMNSIHYLEQNITEPLQLCDLANASGYSLSRFKYKFKELIGITPAEYIIMKKLEYSKRLLQKKEISITDIAYELGFSSSNYFSTVFHKYMNCTPRDYRKRILE